MALSPCGPLFSSRGVAVGGSVIGVGHGHSRRVAETEAAAHGIETLRSSDNETGSSPELAEFLAPEGDSDPQDWGASEDEADAVDEPWIEFDMPAVDNGGSSHSDVR